jgi:hypothetical protein
LPFRNANRTHLPHSNNYGFFARNIAVCGATKEGLP